MTGTTFIVPVRNDAASLRRCLQSIVRCRTPSGIELVVLDNGSTDNSAAVAREFAARVLELPGLKVGELRNRGAAAARGDVLAFVDADHEIGPDWLAAAWDAFAQPDVGGVGAPYSSPDQPTWVQRIYDAFRRHSSDIRDVEWLGAGNLAVRANAFASIGGFDTKLEACEDVDLCQRLRQAGHRLLSDPRLRSVHYGDPASLRALFISELWRGRDNVRVTLRGSRSIRNLTSLVVPVVDLACVVLLVVAAAVFHSPYAVAAVVLVFLLLAALRGVVLFRRLPTRSALDLLRSFVVTCVYDLGRALALVARMPHRRALSANGPPE